MNQISEEHSTTPGGKTGVEDLRNHTVHTGMGRVADAVLAHSNQGEKMIDNVDNRQTPTHEVVDGYADTEGDSDVDSPDPGTEQKIKPLNPEEYAKAQKEAREEHEK